MELKLDSLRKSERTAYLLRRLYEGRGYRNFRMGKFEEYDFYVDHRDFLSSAQIITFTDLNGKLMALKPDVTMSIVKNTRATAESPERLYYSESVYRLSREVREYKEIFQVGVEYIGAVTPYTEIELVDLALKSLALIENDYVLDISHMGFLTGFFSAIDAPAEAKKALLRCLEGKNAHELASIARAYGIDAGEIAPLGQLIRVGGPMGSALKEARPLAGNAAMQDALEELETLYNVFAAAGNAEALRLDFSIANDSNYYNGLMFRGFVRSVPRAVLSGGRYDLLLKRMGKENLAAIGFGVSFDEIDRYFKQPAQNKYDAILLYGEDTDLLALYGAVERLAKQNLRVCALTSLPEDFGNAKVYRIEGTELAEAAL
ncbi:MAG TPA: ATP phosphoribosyltransferase regulatory subunit [Feifaniaceae bacterium]|nr:ATP phosphoribosyltransferase regulatory subunit [Feifaniaceae bacterium]